MKRNINTIYSAGKVWHAEKFRRLRDAAPFFPIVSRWIDLGPQAAGDPRIWDMCLYDVMHSDMLILYMEDQNEEHRGTFVEIGHSIALGKPVYAIGSCKSYQASEVSDVAVTHHKLWHDTQTSNLLEGYRRAVLHYKEHYALPRYDDLLWNAKKC